jgi:hypothetical protein
MLKFFLFPKNFTTLLQIEGEEYKGVFTKQNKLPEYKKSV